MREPLFSVWLTTFLRCVFARSEYPPHHLAYTLRDSLRIADVVTVSCRRIRDLKRGC